MKNTILTFKDLKKQHKKIKITEQNYKQQRFQLKKKIKI